MGRPVRAALDVYDRHDSGERQSGVAARSPARHPHLSRRSRAVARHVHAGLGPQAEPSVRPVLGPRRSTGMVRVSTSSTDTHSSHIHARSYAVPQEVGKVGTESPTFHRTGAEAQGRHRGDVHVPVQGAKKRASLSLPLLYRRLSSSIYEEGQEETRALPGGNDGRVIAGCRHVAVRETRQS